MEAIKKRKIITGLKNFGITILISIVSVLNAISGKREDSDKMLDMYHRMMIEEKLKNHSMINAQKVEIKV